MPEQISESASNEQTITVHDELKAIVIDFLRGKKISEIQLRLQNVCVDHAVDCKDLYKLIILNEHKKSFGIMLKMLNISEETENEETKEKYNKLTHNTDINLYDLLTHLFHDGNQHVGYLLNLIERTKAPSSWTATFILGAFFSTAAGIVYQLNQDFFESIGNWITNTFPSFIEWLGRTFSLLRNLPIFGIVYNGLGLVLHWYQTFSNGITPAAHKLEKLFFKTLTTSLTISAYVLSFLAEGAMSASAAVLFVLSASVDVFKSLYDFIDNKSKLSLIQKPDDQTASRAEKAQYLSAQHVSSHTLNVFWTRFSAALVSTIAVGVWNFFPPGFVITLSCLSVITLTSLAKRSLLASMYSNNARELQDNIRKIYDHRVDAQNESKETLAGSESIEEVQQLCEQVGKKHAELATKEKYLNKAETALRMKQDEVNNAANDMISSLSKTLRSLQRPSTSQPANLSEEKNDTEAEPHQQTGGGETRVPGHGLNEQEWKSIQLN